MTALLVALAYAFSPSTKLNYDVDVQLDGFLPLMGGQEGQVGIKMMVAVTGGEPSDGRLKSSSEIQSFEVAFNGAKLPVGVDNVKEYFPKTTIEIEPTGKIVKSDAPDKKLPIRLPGLDVKHFPDVTYVPIELPAGDVEAGKTWTFSRDFGGAPIEYSCKAESESNGIWTIAVNLRQTYTVLESPTYEVVASEADASSVVKTTMTGEGKVMFSYLAGRVESAEMVNTAKSEVTDLKSKATKARTLVTKYKIKLPTGAQAVASKSTPGRPWWQKIALGARDVLVWLQAATLFGLDALPKELETFRPALSHVAKGLGLLLGRLT